MPVIGLVDKAHFKIQTKMKLLGILFLLCVLTMPVVAQDHCRIMFYNVRIYSIPPMIPRLPTTSSLPGERNIGRRLNTRINY